MKSKFKNSALALAIVSTLAAGSATAAVQINDGLDGAWGNTSESGRGVEIDVLPQADGSAIVTGGVFSYGTDGNPTWILFAGAIPAGGNSATGVTLNRTSGGTFGSPFTSPTTTAVGTANITVNSCRSLTLALDMNAASGLPDVTLNLAPTQVSLGFAANPLCTETPTLASCPTGTTAVGNDCQLPNSITNNLVLPAGKKYIVSGQVSVQNGGSLSIAPGVTVQGASANTVANFIAVLQGGKIFAEGTATQPITFTGPTAEAGSWAGLVIAGRSTCNEATGGQLCQFEAVPSIVYGGNQLDDNSGRLRYVRILHAGQEVAPDEELNALTLMGVGSGTQIEYVQVDNGLDDGIEWFGGTVNVRHTVCSNMADDCYDMAQGYSGKGQFMLAYQGAPASFTADPHGIELDNTDPSSTTAPITQPQFSNMTLVGSAAGAGGEGIRLRRGGGANLSNVVVTGYADRCINLNDNETFGLATGSAQGARLSMTNSFVGACAAGSFEDSTSEPYLVSSWYNIGAGNGEGNPLLTGFLPTAGSPVLTGGSAPSDAFFVPTTYRGAFAGPHDNWTQGWTVRLPN